MRKFLTYEIIKNYIDDDKTGSGCNLLLNEEEFKKEKIKQNKNNSMVKLTIKCKCNNEFYISFSEFKSGQKQCRKCGYKNMILKRNILKEYDVKEYVNKLGFTLISKYINQTEKIVLQDKDDYLYLYPLRHLIAGHRPHAIDKTNPYTISNIKNFCKIENKKFELISDTYIDSSTKLDFKCLDDRCETIFQKSWNEIQHGQGCPQCSLRNMTGENSSCWNPNITDEEREDQRHYSEYYQWRKSVYERDDYTCQLSGYKKGHIIVAHHLDSYRDFKEKRTDVNNGITLTKQIHKLFHDTYGYAHSTKEQFEEFAVRYKNHEFDEYLNQQQSDSQQTA